MVFHFTSGIIEIYAFADGADIAVLADVAVRGIFSFLLFYYGFYKPLNENIANT
jgi:hypothetical protein